MQEFRSSYVGILNFLCTNFFPPPAKFLRITKKVFFAACFIAFCEKKVRQMLKKAHRRKRPEKSARSKNLTETPRHLNADNLKGWQFFFPRKKTGPRQKMPRTHGTTTPSRRGQKFLAPRCCQFFFPHRTTTHFLFFLQPGAVFFLCWAALHFSYFRRAF